MKKCIIMCAGDFVPCDIERNAGDLLIAADNGLTYLDRLGEIPDLVIGDYDSLEEEGRKVLDRIRAKAPEEIITLPVEKDDTDTLAAVRQGLARGYREFYIYAALGGRLDHTVANLQTLNFIKDNHADGTIVEGDLRIFLVRNETVTIPAGPAGDFSLFAVDREIRGVTIRGMKYETDRVTITNNFPIGCSNHFAGDRDATVTVEDGTALVMVKRHTKAGTGAPQGH